jgi:lipopolysaccharide biosynthesis glycosyltransferase
VRCGAVFDKREHKPNIPGDDTGDNISEKRLSYCELTVQYWAWKNVEADYYGLCHYRRYFSFSKEMFGTTDPFGHVQEKYLSKDSAAKYKLDDFQYCREQIERYDIIVPYLWDVRKMPTIRGFFDTVYDRWAAMDSTVVFKRHIDKMIETVEAKYPMYKEPMRSYFKGNQSGGYNCFIMKKAVFDEYCAFLFDILSCMEDEFNKETGSEYFSEVRNRTVGFFAELLIDIFISYQKKVKNLKIKRLQLVRFENVEKQPNLSPAFPQNNIPICFVSSNEFTPFVAVCIKSILNHASKDYNYDFIVMHKEITIERQDMLKQAILDGQTGVSIRFANMDRELNSKEFKKSHPNFAEESYYRMFTPWILKNYPKALVMDCDIVAKADLTELFNEDMSDYYIAGVKDAIMQGMLNVEWHPYDQGESFYDFFKNVLELDEPYNYINTGVLLLNLEKIREDFTTSDVFDTINFVVNQHYAPYQEQDSLNVLFNGKNVKFLDIRWNYYLCVRDSSKEMIKNSSAQMKNIYEFCKNPALIHWAAHPKPWEDMEVERSSEFWEVARSMPYVYEIIIGGYIHNVSKYYMHNLPNQGNQTNQINQRVDGLIPAIENLNKAITETIYPAINDINQRLGGDMNDFSNQENQTNQINQRIEGLIPAIENLNKAVTETIYPAINNINEKLNSNSFLKRILKKLFPWIKKSRGGNR